jgi:hypothetical protein
MKINQRKSYIQGGKALGRSSSEEKRDSIMVTGAGGCWKWPRSVQNTGDSRNALRTLEFSTPSNKFLFKKRVK